MKLLLVTGFLGSGKTTFITKLVKGLIKLDTKVAIFVNEIGEMGIDDQLMKQLDLDVWEVMGGCICCTLSPNLIATLQKIDEKHDVDLVIVEPSGAAEPGNILSALPYYKGTPLESIKTISLLDPLRISELYQVLTPLVTKQVESADQMILTKADLATNDQIESAKRIGLEINPAASVSVFSADKPLTQEFLQEVIS
jgi:G3E family GTPase